MNSTQKPPKKRDNYQERLDVLQAKPVERPELKVIAVKRNGGKKCQNTSGYQQK